MSDVVTSPASADDDCVDKPAIDAVASTLRTVWPVVGLESAVCSGPWLTIDGSDAVTVPRTVQDGSGHVFRYASPTRHIRLPYDRLAL